MTAGPLNGAPSSTASTTRSYRLLDGVVIDDVQVFNQMLQEWEDFYNFNRLHGGLNGQTPYDRLRQETTKASA